MASKGSFLCKYLINFNKKLSIISYYRCGKTVSDIFTVGLGDRLGTVIGDNIEDVHH